RNRIGARRGWWDERSSGMGTGINAADGAAGSALARANDHGSRGASQAADGARERSSDRTRGEPIRFGPPRKPYEFPPEERTSTSKQLEGAAHRLGALAQERRDIKDPLSNLTKIGELGVQFDQAALLFTKAEKLLDYRSMEKTKLEKEMTALD